MATPSIKYNTAWLKLNHKASPIIPTLMYHKLANGRKMCKGNGNSATLLFFLKGLEILHQVRRGQANTIVMEYFNSILFHKSRPANKRKPNNESVSVQIGCFCVSASFVHVTSLYGTPELFRTAGVPQSCQSS